MLRFKTGIKEFNEIIHGLPMPSAILIEGDAGSGKTVFAYSLVNVKDKVKKIVVLTNNTPEEVTAEMESLKIKLDSVFIDCYSWLSGRKAAVDSLANLNKITFLIEDELEEGAIVVFDSLTPLVLYNHEEEIKRFMQQLIAIAKTKSCLVLFILDSGTYHTNAENTFRSLCDGVISLSLEKGMRIVKMAQTLIPNKSFFYEISANGFKLRSK